jgi:uncharacterized protein DUF4440
MLIRRKIMERGASDIENCEADLRQAMLTSDVAQLERLLSATLVFTNQDGARLTKEDDLSAHRSGLLAIEKLDLASEPIVRLLGDTAIVCLTVDLAGKYNQRAFGGKFAYSRIWHRKSGKWQVELGHCSSVRS